MIVAEFKGRKLSNAASAIAFYYPRVSGGRDLLTDLRKDKDGGLGVTLLIYAAFRMAGDPEARKKKPEELTDEVNVFDREEVMALNEVLAPLLNEKSPNAPKKV